MRFRFTTGIALLALFWTHPILRAGPSAESQERQFSSHVQPFLQRYCFPGHGPTK